MASLAPWRAALALAASAAVLVWLAANRAEASAARRAVPRGLLQAGLGFLADVSDTRQRFVVASSGGRVAIEPSSIRVCATASAGAGDHPPARSGRRLESTVLRFAGARPGARLRLLDGWKTRVWAFTGGPHGCIRRAIPWGRELVCSGLYPGVDLVYYEGRQGLEYDLRVVDSAALSRIRLHVEGADAVRVGDDGDLVITSDGREIALRRPRVYQATAGRRMDAPCGYAVRREPAGGTYAVHFVLGPHRAGDPLIIDPLLDYSTYVGDDAVPEALAVDSQGSAYVAGATRIPLATRAQTDWKHEKAFLAKFGPNGSLIYAIYLGGDGDSAATGVSVDQDGAAYLAGDTAADDFPLRKPLQRVRGGRADAFVTKLNPAGTALVYSTYLGGRRNDYATGIAVDGSGRAHVVGATSSRDFPLRNALRRKPSKRGSTFVAELEADGSRLAFSTYFGGGLPCGVATDAIGSTYVAGTTSSADVPMEKPLQPELAGSLDLFVSKFTPDGSRLVYSTYLGGNSGPTAEGLAVDASGAAYVTGSTYSTNYPTTPGAFQTVAPSNAAPYGSRTPPPPDVGDSFITKLAPDGQSLAYSSYLGGNSDDEASAVAVGADGSAVVVGTTDSTDFPLAQPWQAQNLRRGQGFVTRFDPSGGSLIYSSYLGSPGTNRPTAIAVDGSGATYVAGYTELDAFPVFRGWQEQSRGQQPGFLVKIAEIAGSGRIALSDEVLDFSANSKHGNQARSLEITNVGSDPLSVTVGSVDSPFVVTSGGGDYTLAPHESHEVVVVLRTAREFGRLPFGYLPVTSSDPEAPVQFVSLQGRVK